MPPDIAPAPEATPAQTPATESQQTPATTEGYVESTDLDLVKPKADNLDLSQQDPNNNGSAWLQNLPEEYRTDGTFTKYTSEEAFYKGVKEMSQVMRTRQEVAKMPDENSTPEQKAAWRKHIGAPDTISNYETPETIKGLDAENLKGLFGDQGFNEVLGLFDELNITQHQANKLTDGYLNMIGRMGDSFDAEQINAKNAANEKAQSDLKADWGDNYDANLTVYSSLVEQMGVRDTLKDHGLENNVDMIRMFTKISSHLGEHSIAGTLTGGYGDSYETRVANLNARKAAGEITSTAYTAEWNLIHKDAYGPG